MLDAPSNEKQSIVYGIHAVNSVLDEKPELVHRVILLLNSNNPKLYSLQKKAKKKMVHTQQLPSNKLDIYTKKHQGVVAICHEREIPLWAAVKDTINLEADVSTIVFGYGIEDPRNLGAILRTSLALKIDAVALPTKGTCALSPTVAKAACGALEKLQIARVKNFDEWIEELTGFGYEVTGLDEEAENHIHQFSFKPKQIIIIGGEDKGIPPHIQRKCTSMTKIPLNSDAHSYNASVALSLALYERERQNEFKKVGL